MSLRTRFETQHTIINALGAGNATIASAVPGQQVSIYKVIIENTGAAATNVTFQDSAGAPISATYTMGVNGFIILDVPINNEPWFVTGSGLGARLNSSAAGPVQADIYWLQTV